MNGDEFVHLYNGVSKEELTSKVFKILTSMGYILIEGNQGAGTYEKGNRTMRILFGAFVKYFKFHVFISAEPSGEVKLRVYKQTSGFSGGLIGISQVKNEMGRLATNFQTV